MDQFLWKRIDDLFQAARLLNGESRITFLKQNCGSDQDLFERVMSLLDVDGKSDPLDSATTVSGLPSPQVIAGRFRIIHYIGAGGMGTVYEAQDLRLKDRVALKMIRPEIARNPRAVERFKREILLGKKVTHPNVCRIHDLGVDRSDNGAEFLFLTMQFLSGETLASRIKRGPIPDTEAFPLIEDMADALSAAHHADVIHRDFKSGNVMLVNSSDRNSAVVTDFGLAHGIHDRGSLTNADIVGTVDYMAPEQIRGEEITPAVDIYALGVVMYEMATGQRPFTGDSKVTVALKHLNDEPRPPRDFVPNLDSNWSETILGCLRKSPHERFQAAAEVKAALVGKGEKSRKRLWLQPSKRAGGHRYLPLRWTIPVCAVILVITVLLWLSREQRSARVRAALPARSLAVLPLANLSSNSEQEYFVDGMTDELITQLGTISALKVISRTSVMHYKHTHETVPVIAKELNVDAIVQGSVLQSGDRVRITIQLTDARTDENLWAESYERDLRDVVKLQDEVAVAITRQIRMKLTPREQAQLSNIGTIIPEAYNAYLKGRFFWNQRTPEGFRKALPLFLQAIEEDPSFAQAYCGLADTYTLLQEYGVLSPQEAYPLARSAAVKAIQLNDGLSEAHNSLAAILEDYDRDWASSEREYKRAIELNPNYATAHQWYGTLLTVLGRSAESISEGKQANELAPLTPRVAIDLGYALFHARRYDEAIAQARKALELDPRIASGYLLLGRAYQSKNLNDEAIQQYQKGEALQDSIRVQALLAYSYAKAGKTEQAVKKLHHLESQTDPSARYYHVAMIYVGLKNYDKALDAVEQAARWERDKWPQYFGVEETFDPIRLQPRFQAVLRDLHLN